MNDYDRIRELWAQQDYMGVVSAIWQLPATENYPYLRSVIRLHDFTLSGLVSRACRQAVTSSSPPHSDQAHQKQASRWVADLLHDFSSPIALVDHSDGEEAEAFRSHILHAHLLCVNIVLEARQESVADAGALRSDSDVALTMRRRDRVARECRRIAQETGLPLAFFRDLLFSLLPEGEDPYRLLRVPAVSLTALLVGQTQRQGIVATLSVELRSGGGGLCYPAPDLAFVRRDRTFQEAELTACKYVKDTGLWKADLDARWMITRRDGQPVNALTGSSMGFAFALALAKLFTAA